jgi:RNA polymerase sigma factor (sigma-70 family)
VNVASSESSPAAAPAPEDLAALVVRIRPRLRAVLARYRIPPQDAEDVLQESFLVALVKWESILCIESWLLGTLRLKCALYWKRRRTDRLQGMEAEALEELCAPLPPQQEHEERRLDLESLTCDLDTRHRAALWLRFGEGLRSHEVATELGFSPTSIRKVTYRCLEKVQRRAAGLTPRF